MNHSPCFGWFLAMGHWKKYDTEGNNEQIGRNYLVFMVDGERE